MVISRDTFEGYFFPAILIALAFLLPSCSKKPQQASSVRIMDTSIRKLNWDSLLMHDKTYFELDSNMNEVDSTGKVIANYYRIATATEQGGFFGNPYYPTKYIDLNSDGREDAIVSLSNPGSGAYATAVIFLRPRMDQKYVGCAGGPHFRDTLNEDTLDVITGHWLHDEPQCCPDAEDHQRIIAENDSLHFFPVRVDTLR